MADGAYTRTPLWKAVSNDDVAAVKKLLANGDNPNDRVQNSEFDVESSYTALGTALACWCSPALIAALIAGGADVNALMISDNSEKPLQFVVGYQSMFAEDPAANFWGFQREYCGRGPNAAWFVQVKKLLVDAGAH